jgi:nitrogenase subunit NifH
MVRKIAIYGKNEIGRSKTKIGPTEAMAHFHFKSSMVHGSNLQVKCKKNLLVKNLQTKVDESNIVEKNIYREVIEYLERINLGGN